MNMETPKNYDKKSQYTSPIGLLKNYSSINAPNSNNNYEEQFYKIKAQRLEAEIEQLKEQNSVLKNKYTDCNATNQILRQKIFIIENNYDRAQRSFTQRTVPSFISDSNYPSAQNSGRESPSKGSNYFSVSIPNEKSQRTYNAQIERLVKENRVLKNQHQVQMTKLRDQNKRINRKMIQIESNFQKKSNQGEPEVEERIYRQKQQQRILKIEKANYELRKDNQEFEKEKRKSQDKLRVLQQNNKALRRQNEELKILNSSNSRDQNRIQQLRELLSTKQQDYQTKISELQQQFQKYQQNKTSTPSQNPLKQSQIKQSKNPSAEQSQKLYKQLQLLKRKMRLQEQVLSGKDEQIKNILTKLKPLLEKQRNRSPKGSAGEVNRASLSILEVFLKKYKINSF